MVVSPAVVAVPPVMAASLGFERRGVELAVQALALIVEGVDEVAAVFDADGDVPPPFAFELRLQGFQRLPVAERRIAERVGGRAVQAKARGEGETDEERGAHRRPFSFRTAEPASYRSKLTAG